MGLFGFGKHKKEDDKKADIAIPTDNAKCYPVALNTNKEEVDIERYAKSPLTTISALGAAFEPLSEAFQNITSGTNGATSGLYRVTIPKGAKLVEFTNGSGYTGAITRGNNQVGGGMAVLNPVACNPAMIFMAAALMSIDKKLDNIQETQKEILEFLEQKEKTKLRGNFVFLTDILNNYKHNWANEKYKSSNHIKVLDIRQESEQSILFYREQIDKKIKKKSLLHSDKDVKDTLVMIQSELQEYQLTLYLYSFSSFLEVMLLENFESAYLEGIARKIEDYELRYCELYTGCYNQIEDYSKSSVQSISLNGLSKLSKAAGNAAAKIPVINKSQLNESLAKTSDRLGEFGSRRTGQTLNKLSDLQNSTVRPFIENINTIDRLYNQPLEMLFDKENIYLRLPDTLI